MVFRLTEQEAANLAYARAHIAGSLYTAHEALNRAHCQAQCIQRLENLSGTQELDLKEMEETATDIARIARAMREESEKAAA